MVEIVEENVQVTIEDVSFEPNKLTLSVGETVEFTNNRPAVGKKHLLGVRELRDVESGDLPEANLGTTPSLNQLVPDGGHVHYDHGIDRCR